MLLLFSQAPSLYYLVRGVNILVNLCLNLRDALTQENHWNFCALSKFLPPNSRTQFGKLARIE